MDRINEQNNLRSVSSLNATITGDLERFDYPEFDYVINIHNIYDKTGNLPYPGSISEQPAKIIELLSILDQLNLERRQRDQAERERKMKKNG